MENPNFIPEKENGIAWLKKHADTLVILGSFALCFWNLNEKINAIDKDLTVIKTVLTLKNIMSPDLAKCVHSEKKEGV